MASRVRYCMLVPGGGFVWGRHQCLAYFKQGLPSELVPSGSGLDFVKALAALAKACKCHLIVVREPRGCRLPTSLFYAETRRKLGAPWTQKSLKEKLNAYSFGLGGTDVLQQSANSPFAQQPQVWAQNPPPSAASVSFSNLTTQQASSSQTFTINTVSIGQASSPPQPASETGETYVFLDEDLSESPENF